jgi:hypothetical protein
MKKCRKRDCGLVWTPGEKLRDEVQWQPRSVPFYRGDAVLDLILGLS